MKDQKTFSDLKHEVDFYEGIKTKANTIKTTDFRVSADKQEPFNESLFRSAYLDEKQSLTNMSQDMCDKLNALVSNGFSHNPEYNPYGIYDLIKWVKKYNLYMPKMSAISKLARGRAKTKTK
jgi:hypothetical protein